MISTGVLHFPKSQLPASLHPYLFAPQQSHQLGAHVPVPRVPEPSHETRQGIPVAARRSPASPSGECRTEPPRQQGCASRLAVPSLPPTARPASRPSAACQVSLAMGRVVRRSVLASSPRPPQAGRPPDSRQIPSRHPPASSRLPAPPSAAALPEAAHGRTLLGAAAGRRGRLHRCPAHPGQQPPVQVRARAVPPPPSHAEAPGGCSEMFSRSPEPSLLGGLGPAGSSGSPGQLGGPTWLVRHSPHTRMTTGGQGCPGVAHPGQPSSLRRRESSQVCPDPLCP